MFVPLSQKKIAQMLFDLQYYGYPVPEPMLMKMSAGTIILRYNQLMKKVKEEKESSNKVVEAILKRSCPFMFK